MNLLELVKGDPGLTVAQDASFRNLTFNTADLLPDCLTFAGNPHYLGVCVASPLVSAVITEAPIFDHFMRLQKVPVRAIGIAFAPRPRETFFRLHNWLCRSTDLYRRDVSSWRGAGCRVSSLASVESSGVILGDRVVIEDFVKIHPHTKIGDDTIIGTGSVIGGPGFQFLRMASGEVLAVDHAGGVCLGKDVELQASCHVARHIFNDETLVGDGSKLDAFVHVGHCAKIGSRCRIAARATIAGSARIGNDVWIGPSATISNEVAVGDGAQITLGAVVVNRVPAGQRVSGNFAIPHDRFIRAHTSSLR